MARTGEPAIPITLNPRQGDNNTFETSFPVTHPGLHFIRVWTGGEDLRVRPLVGGFEVVDVGGALGDAVHPCPHGSNREEDRAEQHPEENEELPPRGVAEEGDRQLDDVGDQVGESEEDADFDVGEGEIIADLRPGGLAGTEGELIEKLDEEEERDQAAQFEASDRRGYGTWMKPSAPP